MSSSTERTERTARVEPRVFGLEELLDQISDGRLRVPKFQRDFVWSRDLMLKLLESIRKRYPIGSLLLWSTEDRYQSFSRVGPIQVPMDKPATPVPVSYLLDGHQRLSTLFGTLRLQEKDEKDLKGRDRAFCIYYDLKAQSFVYARSAEIHHLPTRLLLDNIALADFTVRLLKENTDRKEAETLARRAKEVASSFINYRVAVTYIEGANLTEAVNIFGLLNRQGLKVKPAQLFSALTYREDPSGQTMDFAIEAKKILSDIPGFEGESTNTVLRCLLVAIGNDAYRVDWDKIREKPVKDIQGAIQAVKQSFRQATEFMATRIGATSSKVVPYMLQLLLLSEFYRACPHPSDGQLVMLEKWIWSTSFSGVYMVGGSRVFAQALEAARALAEGNETPALAEIRREGRPFPRRFHARSARVRAFLLFLKAQNPRDLRDGKELPKDALLKRGMADTAVISPKEEHRRLLANRIFAPRRSEVKDLLLHATSGNLFQRGDPAILQSHVIPLEALDRLAAGDYNDFIALREKALIEREREFAKQYVNLPDIDAEDEPDIDVDEDESESLDEGDDFA